MCNLYELDPRKIDRKLKQLKLDIGPIALLPKKYKVRPTLPAPVIFGRNPHCAELMPWGFKDTYPGAPLVFNARDDKLLASPLWKPLTRAHRCLLLADTFFEYEKIGKSRVPHGFKMTDDEAFYIAGLYRPEPTPACVMVTTVPNERVALYHNRMPVILDDSAAMAWLSEIGPLTPGLIAMLCRPYDATKMADFSAREPDPDDLFAQSSGS
jgi:putative SOS response-associated peptidase YedK